MAAENNRTVTIVDDDSAILDSLKFLLEIEGYKVATYSSAAAFLDDRHLRPACLILDQHMPRMTGLELVAHLRARGSSIPVLLFSGQLSPAIIARATELDVVKVLPKPPAEDELLSFIDVHK